METEQLTTLGAKYVFVWSRIPIKPDLSDACVTQA